MDARPHKGRLHIVLAGIVDAYFCFIAMVL